MAACSTEGCDREVYCKGWCEKHYRQATRGSRTPTVRQDARPCKVAGCAQPATARGRCLQHYREAFGDPAASTECSLDGCERKAYSGGWCEKHYRRALRNGGVQPGERFEPSLCQAEGCGRDAVTKGFCHGHYQRVRATGDPQADRPLRGPAKLCIVQGCDRTSHTAGHCKSHYRRIVMTGDARPDVPLRAVGTGTSISHGYRWVTVPPEDRDLTDGRDRELEHRLVMARLLGRPLTADESVHHRNGDRLDSRPENLELWSRYQPAGQRTCDKVEWAFQILLMYAPELLAQDADLSTCQWPTPRAAERDEGE